VDGSKKLWTISPSPPAESSYFELIRKKSTVVSQSPRSNQKKRCQKGEGVDDGDRSIEHQCPTKFASPCYAHAMPIPPKGVIRSHPIPLTPYQDAKENHPTGQQKGTGRYGCDGSCQDLSQCHANGHDDDELQNQHQQFKERTTLSSINLKQ
jgi:hypothetical protein